MLLRPLRGEFHSETGQMRAAVWRGGGYLSFRTQFGDNLQPIPGCIPRRRVLRVIRKEIETASAGRLLHLDSVLPAMCAPCGPMCPMCDASQPWASLSVCWR